MSREAMNANPDRALIRAFQADGRQPLDVDACAFARELGMRLLAIDVEAGTASLSFGPDQRFTQGAGMLQGGIVTAMLDFGMAYAALARLDDSQHTVTASLTVNMLKPAPVDEYVVDARLDRAGRNLLFCAAELRRLTEDSLIATASAVMPVLTPRAA